MALCSDVMGGHILLLLMAVLLLTTVPVSSQEVQITGTSATFGDNHLLTCMLVGSDATNLQYRWSRGDEVLQTSTSNEFRISSVRPDDAGSDYSCEVLSSGTVIASGTANLTVAIQNFTMSFFREVSTDPVNPYVGSNISYVCRTLFPGNSVGLVGEVGITDPSGTVIESNDARLRVSDVEQVFNNYERTLFFSPLSADDVGVYTCTGTIQPLTPNPLVTNGMGTTTQEISIIPLELDLQISTVSGRYLDIEPYNTLTLSCTVSLVVRNNPAPLNVEFSWFRSVDSGPLEELTSDLYTNSRVFGHAVSSDLSVRTEQPGSHTYTCRVNLDVRPAPDVRVENRSVSLQVTGPVEPLLPVEVTTPPEGLFHNRVTVQWLVRSLSYGPEAYTVLYRAAGADTYLGSEVVTSGADITLTNFSLSVELMDLNVSTEYEYLLEVNNTVNITSSPVQTFTTTDLPPDPPQELRFERSDINLTSYQFFWARPDEVNGELSQYKLTCLPSGGGAPITMTFDPPETSGEVTGFKFLRQYQCFVQARNMAALSLPSDRVSFNVTESEPEAVMCNSRWSDSVPRPEGVDVTVTWQPTTNQNGITLGYTLQFLAYDDNDQLATASVNASVTRFTFTQLDLSEGVPYTVSIAAENSAGLSPEPCYQTDFFDQTPPPPVRGLRVTRPSGTEIKVEWEVPGLADAGGFLEYEVHYSVVPPDGQRSTRQEVGVACSSSPCRVPVEDGGVNIVGLDTSADYSVSVQPFNGERESGETAVRTVAAPSSEFPLLPVVIGVVVGVVALAVLILLCLIICVCCCRQRKSREFGVQPRPLHNIEMDKKYDYVNDTDLGDATPLYASVPVQERMRLIPAQEFTFHVRDMHANRDTKFEKEYESLGNETLASYEIAKLNKAKNRFANIFPYDFCRVKLEGVDGVEGSDYINASFIDGYKQANAYIAAQGPMPNTIGDHWRMIWDLKLTSVVMLTKVTEAGKKKCEQYWPDTIGRATTQPNTTLQVTLKELLPFADYEIRRFEVHDVSEGCSEVPLSVTQFHFLGWPDHGVPKFATSLIEFIRRVRHSYSCDRPILVHCGAGVGRTGTYITLDSMLERMKQASDLNVYEFVRNMRAKRVLMVQTQAQYMFIHDALEELITCGETSIQAPQLREAINALTMVDPNTAVTGFEEQFNLLNTVSRRPTDSDLSDALQHYNESKNRYQDRVPYNSNRVRLRPNATSGTEYINASFVDGYKHRNAYIATQAPLETTVEDFWRMIWEFKSKVIVLLCKTQEDNQEACYQYWPEKEGMSSSMGKLLVTLKSEKSEKEVIERKIEIKEEKADGTPGQGFIVTQYHYQHWPEHDRPGTSTGLLQLIKSLNNAQRNSGNKPVTVMCNDGVGRTGSFICIHAMLERVNTENILDFFQFIKSSRIHRPSLVLELEHYRFCHDVLADYLNSLESYANFKDLS